MHASLHGQGLPVCPRAQGQQLSILWKGALHALSVLPGLIRWIVLGHPVQLQPTHFLALRLPPSDVQVAASCVWDGLLLHVWVVHTGCAAVGDVACIWVPV